MAHDNQHAVRTPEVSGRLAVERIGGPLMAAADADLAYEDAAHLTGSAQPCSNDPERARLICLVAAERAGELLSPLRDHFAGEPLVAVAVVVERRTANRRRLPLEPAGQARRRAPVAERDPVRSLPPELRHEAPHLRFVQRMEPLRRTYENTDTADLVDKSLAIEPEAVSELWWRVSERVLTRLELHLGPLAADGAARDMLGRILDGLPTYQPEWEPLTAWLDAVVDRYAHERTGRSSRHQSGRA